MMTMIGTLQSVPLHPWKHTQSIPTILPCPEQAAHTTMSVTKPGGRGAACDGRARRLYDAEVGKEGDRGGGADS
jgi:hypothetical protein